MMVGQLSAGCMPCMMASGGDMGVCFPDGDEGPPACVAACDWSAGCPADCDTTACPADGVPNKAEIDADFAGGCDEGGGDDTCTAEDLPVLMAMDGASDEEQGAMMGQLSAGCMPCMMAAGDDAMSCFPDGDTTCTAEDFPIVESINAEDTSDEGRG